MTAPAGGGGSGTDVWTVDLDRAFADPGQARSLLCDAERARADRFRDATLGRRWCASRAALRVVLSGYLDVAPGRVRFREGANAKPALADAALHFSNTRSGPHGAIAVSTDAPVGVDVEAIREMPDVDAIASRFFARPERERLVRLPAGARTRAFLECWTRKEAVLKATGDGIATLLDRLVVSFGDQVAPRVLSFEGSRLGDTPWTLEDVSGPGVVRALARPVRAAPPCRVLNFRGP